MWMKWPCSCQRVDRLDRARVRLGGEHVLGAVGLLHAGLELLGLERGRSPTCTGVSYGQLDAEAAPGDLGQLVPVRVQRRVDVDREAHGRWYGSGVSGFIGQVRALPGQRVPAARSRTRRTPTATTRPGSTVDWPSLTRAEMVLGRRINLIDTGGDRPAAAVPARARRAVAELAAEHPGVHGPLPRARARPAGVRRLGDAGGADLDPGLRAGDRRALRRGWRSSRPGRRRQLDGRLHRRRAGAGLPDARAQARADLRRGDLGREHVARAGHGRSGG